MTGIFDELNPDDIDATRQLAEDQLTNEQLLALKEFIELSGGTENAKLALQTLQDLEDAA